MITVPCRSCKKPIVWARNTSTGKRAPIDAEPDNKGNCVLAGHGREASYKVLGTVEERQAAVLNDVELRTNHFQTCDDPERFRQ